MVDMAVLTRASEKLLAGTWQFFDRTMQAYRSPLSALTMNGIEGID